MVLHFAVSDTGIGIPADKIQVLFKPFEQVEDNPYRKASGTGLGLAISSQLVGLMGGRIWVDSQAGKGSTFHFTACFGEGKESVPPPASGDPSLLIGLPVLVVDDKPASAQDLSKTLSGWGMRPTVLDVSAKTVDAVRQAEEAGDPYVLVLVQAALEGVDAFTLARDIKQIARPGGHHDRRRGHAGRPGPLPRTGTGRLSDRSSRPASPAGSHLVRLDGGDRQGRLRRSRAIACAAGAGPCGCCWRKTTPSTRNMPPRCSRSGAMTVLAAGDGMKALEALAMHRFRLSSRWMCRCPRWTAWRPPPGSARARLPREGTSPSSP